MVRWESGNEGGLGECPAGARWECDGSACGEAASRAVWRMPTESPPCPECAMDDVAAHAGKWECMTCGHEWPREAVAASPEGARVVRDAVGNVLADGDDVVLIKDLRLRGSSQVLKQGTKAKGIRLVDGDHDIDCKVDGSRMGLKSCFVRKA